MDKKDIYEHLAKIYLDTPSVKKKKSKSQSKDHKNFIIIAVAIVLGLSMLISARLYLHKPLEQGIALVLSTEPVKMNYNFDPAKKEIFSLNLNKSNLSRFNALGFSLKKSNYDDIISLRVEFTNVFNEKSEVYVKDIPNKWKYYELKFSDFKGITDWSEMSDVSFIIEEWNTRENKGLVYIDNVRMFK
jgi:hypothetical protein